MSRDFYIAIGVILLFSVGIWYFRQAPTDGGQHFNLANAEKHLPRVQAVVDADPRFQNVKVFVYTGQNGAIGLLGPVEKEADLFRLMKAVAEEKLPVAISWQVSVMKKESE